MRHIASHPQSLASGVPHWIFASPLNIQDTQTPPPTPTDPSPPPLLLCAHPFDCDWQCLCSIVHSCRLWWRHILRHSALLYTAQNLQFSHQLHCGLKASSVHWEWANMDAGAPHRMAGAIVCRRGTLSPEDPRQTIGHFKGGPGGPDPMGKEGQLEREAQSCAMCLRRPSLGFTPPWGWEPGHILSYGTKRGVYVRRVGGPREGFWWGTGHDLFISINRSLTWPLDMLIDQIQKHKWKPQTR